MKIYKISQHGEWWIIDGQAVYADMETGDTGHEAYVLEHARREVAEYMGYYLEEIYDWEETKQEIIKYLVQKGELDEEELISKYGDDYLEEMPYGSNLFDEIAIEEGLEKEQLDAADNATDPRDYGMKNLGWKRVESKFVQTYTLTSKDLDSIVGGLDDAFGDEYGEKLDEIKFDIEVMSNQKRYYNVPFYVLKKRNPAKIREYGGKYTAYDYSFSKNEVRNVRSN